MNELVQKLVGYHGWANRTIIEHLKTLPDDIFTKEIDSVFPTVSQTMGHIFSVDDVWLSRMRQKTPGFIGVQVFPDIDAAEKVLVQLKESFDAFLQSEHDVTRKIIYQNTKGVSFQQTVFEIIQHVVFHGTYHRGNIAAMIRQLGYQGTSTDYITFLRLESVMGAD